MCVATEMQGLVMYVVFTQLHRNCRQPVTGQQNACLAAGPSGCKYISVKKAGNTGPLKLAFHHELSD